MNKLFEITQTLNLDDIEKSEAEAAINLNSDAVSFASFILTDDLPNQNKQRVPKEEFQNLIKTGVYMPIKMALGEIEDGHDFSMPLGVITHLKEVGNQIKGLAAFWKRERPEDVDILKDMITKGTLPQLSWEIMYSDSKVSEDGVEELLGTSLKAATIVNLPAYAGRTPILALSSIWTTAYINDLPDSSFLYVEDGDKDEQGKTTPREKRHFPYKDKEGNIDLPHLRNAIARIPQANIPEELKTKLQEKARKLLEKNSAVEDNTLEELEELKNQVEELKTSLSAKEEEMNSKIAEMEELKKVNLELLEFKTSIEKEREEVVKLNSIKQKFVESGIKKEDAYYEDHKDILLRLSEEDLEFMIQELVAFASAPVKETVSSSNLPLFTGVPKPNLDPKEIGKALRESKSK